jgi:hypothetical protein
MKSVNTEASDLLRPFSYPKDASEFRKQFCVGEYSAKKKDRVRQSEQNLPCEICE